MNQINRRLFHRGLAVLLLAGLIVPLASHDSPAAGQSLWAASVRAATPTITDLQKQKQALEKKLKEDEAKKKQKQEEQKKLQGQISDINVQIAGVEDKIDETQNSIDLTEEEIQIKEQEIELKNQELVEQQGFQDETIRTIYQTGDPSLIEFLVGSMTYSDYLSYLQYLDRLEVQIEQTMDEITRLRTELEGKKTELEGKRADLQNLEAQQQAYQKALANQRQEKDRLFKNAKTAEERLTAQIEEAKKVYADVNNELTKLMEAARRRAAQRSRGEIPKGVSNLGFQYPTAFLYMSCQFGCRTPFQSFHTGIDVVNYMGTPVVAAADGVVTAMNRVSYGYGTFVTVAHNERFTTIYAHFQDFAEGLAVGQTVKRGDPLGYIGLTGWTTGPHLHFEIREYGIPVDPMDYLP